MSSLEILPLEGQVNDTREDHMQLVLLAIRSGTKYENFRNLLARLLKIHFDKQGPKDNELNLDLWAINREINFLPITNRIRINQMYIVDIVTYMDLHRRLEVISHLG